MKSVFSVLTVVSLSLSIFSTTLILSCKPNASDQEKKCCDEAKKDSCETKKDTAAVEVQKDTTKAH